MITNRRWIFVCFWFVLPAAAQAQGVLLSSFGPVNASMGGASTAAPIEAMSAVAWNPASISGLPTSELSFGLGMMLSDITLDSSVPGWSSGSTGAEPGVTALPNIAWVHKCTDTTTFGLGIMAVGGFKANYPASLTNPVLAPPSNGPRIPGGLGSLSSEGSFQQLAPMVSFALTERLSIGVGGTITLGQCIVDPLLLAEPDDADRSRMPTYPPGRGTRLAWGGGMQLGAYYITDSCWHLGASIKTPQWMEEFRVHTEDELGRPYVAKFKCDLPMIISLGAAYSGVEDLVWAVDLRYVDYRNTDGFGDQGYTPYGALKGLSWSNQFVFATGLQYRMTDCFLLRTGYTFNTSPFGDQDTFYNVASPLNYQHQYNVGGSLELSDCVAFHLSYTHYFEYGSTGPIILPTGTVPGSSVTNKASADIASLGVTVKY